MPNPRKKAHLFSMKVTICRVSRFVKSDHLGLCNAQTNKNPLTNINNVFLLLEGSERVNKSTREETVEPANDRQERDTKRDEWNSNNERIVYDGLCDLRCSKQT